MISETPKNRLAKLFALVIFGISFGFLEAVVVTYLRKLFGYEAEFKPGEYKTLLNLGAIVFISPANSIIPNSLLVAIERLREVSTIIMLLSVAYIAGHNLKERFGAFLISFALWDIFYYVFLKVLIDWPKTIFDIDIFFLLPYVWAGPVVTAIVSSLILLVIGLKLMQQK